MNVDAVALGEALLQGPAAMMTMMELDEERLRVMPGDDHLALPEAELVTDGRLHLPGTGVGWPGHGPGDSSSFLPLSPACLSGK